MLSQHICKEEYTLSLKFHNDYNKHCEIASLSKKWLRYKEYEQRQKTNIKQGDFLES